MRNIFLGRGLGCGWAHGMGLGFSGKYGDVHLRRARAHFCPPPPSIKGQSHQGAARSRNDQTNNKQTTNKVTRDCAI
jgi:hypothetical protein